MHILYVSNNFPKPDQPGVPRPWQMATYWVKKGYKVTVVVNARHYMKVNDNVRSLRTQKLIRQSQEAGLKIIEVMTSEGKRRSLSRRILNYVTFSFMSLVAGLPVKNVDLVYVRTPPILSSFTGYILSILKRAVFVLEIGDLHPDESVALGLIRNPFLINLWEAWENFFRRKSKLIVAVVPGIKRLLVRKGFSEEKIEVITNAYDPPMESKSVHESITHIKDLFEEQHTFYVAYAGSMGKAISLSCTVRAAKIIQTKELNGIRFVFIGDGDNKANLQQKCRLEGIKNCIFHDPVPSSQIVAILSHMDVLFHSVYSGEFHGYNLPNKVFTYLGAGKPLLFAGTGDIADIIDKAKCGVVVPPENAEKFADAVIKLYENRDQLKQIGKRGYEYVTKNFNRRRILKRLDGRLNAVLE